MDCGVPFCNNACPLGNLIPDWNDLARVGDWQGAIEQLHATNNFPEFTGLICPAPCESACVLDIDDDPVMIKQIEYWTIDNAFKEGWVQPQPPETADRQAGRRGRLRARRAGGGGGAQQGRPSRDRLRAGRGARAACCGSAFPTRSSRSGSSTGASICSCGRGSSSSATSTSASTSAPSNCAPSTTRWCIAIGSRVERELEVPGRELDGVHFAMEYLYGRNRWVAESQGRVREACRAHDHGRRQARRRDRRRRHRHGLRLQRAARGRRGRAAARRLSRRSRAAAATRTRPGRSSRGDWSPPTPSRRAASAASAARCSAWRARTAGSPGRSPAR